MVGEGCVIQTDIYFHIYTEFWYITYCKQLKIKVKTLKMSFLSQNKYLKFFRWQEENSTLNSIYSK